MKQISYNRTLRGISPKYIVIHDTGNRKNGSDAEAHFNFTFFGQSLKNPKVLMERTRAPLFMFGDRYVYYGYRDYDLTVYLGNQNYMDLQHLQA